MLPYNSPYSGRSLPGAPVSLAMTRAYPVIDDDVGLHGLHHPAVSNYMGGPKPGAQYPQLAQRDTYEPPARTYRSGPTEYSAPLPWHDVNVPETPPIGAPSSVDQESALSIDYGSPVDQWLTERVLTQALLEVSAMGRAEPVPVDLPNVIANAIAGVPSHDGESAFDSPVSRDGGVEPAMSLIGQVNGEVELGRHILDGRNGLDELLEEDFLVRRAPSAMMMDLQ